MLTTSRRCTRVRLLGAFALVATAAALGACGGSDKPQAAAAGTPERPLVGKITEETPSGRNNEVTETAAQATKAKAKAQVEAKAQADEAPDYTKLLEHQSKRPRSAFTPCNLVSPGQARAILGTDIQAPLEAAQGPTCIYRTKSGSSFVTVAVQPLELSRVTRHLRGRRAVSVSRRPAYCGVYGQPVLYAALPGRRVLAIGARCGVARKFAARAVQAFDATDR